MTKPAKTTKSLSIEAQRVNSLCVPESIGCVHVHVCIFCKVWAMPVQPRPCAIHTAPVRMLCVRCVGVCMRQHTLVHVRPCAFFSMFLVTRPRSFWLKKKKKKLRITKSGPVDRRCHARNTRTSRLHLQTRLSGRRNFFTVIARRKKNFVWNLNLGRASHLTSDLGKTNAFAMLMNVSVEDSSTFFAREERSSTRKSQTFVATGSYHCLVIDEK